MVVHGGQTDGRTDGQTDRQTDRQTGQLDTQTRSYLGIMIADLRSGSMLERTTRTLNYRYNNFGICDVLSDPGVGFFPSSLWSPVSVIQSVLPAHSIICH